MRMKPSDLSLYLVTDRSWQGVKPMETLIGELLEAGVTFLQYREKNLSFEENLLLAGALKKAAAKQGVPYVVNDDVALALAVDADGVHVGQSDLAAAAARARIGSDKILGVSVQTVEDALKAQADGADYLGVGAVFPTDTKQDAAEVSFETLKAICEAVHIPVVAIGGIQEANLAQLSGTGIDGIAVISAILAQKEPAAAAKRLRAGFERMKAASAVLKSAETALKAEETATNQGGN